MATPPASLGKYINPEELPIQNLRELNVLRYIAWVLYDVANSFYASGILTIISSTWITIVGQQNGYSYAQSNFFFNVTITVSSIIIALMLPILGSLSDVTQKRKNYVIFFTGVTVISTALFVLFNQLWVVILIFSLSMISYQWAQVFYDSMLPGVVPPGKEARFSAIAIAIGYIGGITVGLYAFFLQDFSVAPNADPTKGDLTFGYYPELILFIIIGFTLLTIPLLFVRETNWTEINKVILLKNAGLDPDNNTIEDISMEDIDKELEEQLKELQKNLSLVEITQKSFSELKDTFIDIYHNNMAMLYYIIAYFIIADFANIITLINVQYMRDSLLLDEGDIFWVMGISASSLLIFTYPIGMVCDKYGAKRGFQIIAILWTVALFILIFENILFPRFSIYFAAILMGPALSGVWVSQRQMVLELVPDEGSIGRYFGLTKFSGKLSSAIGPLIFGSSLLFFKDNLNYSTETAYKWSILMLTIFLILGFVLLQLKVPNLHQEYIKRKNEMLEALNSY